MGEDKWYQMYPVSSKIWSVRGELSLVRKRKRVRKRKGGGGRGSGVSHFIEDIGYDVVSMWKGRRKKKRKVW